MESLPGVRHWKEVLVERKIKFLISRTSFGGRGRKLTGYYIPYSVFTDIIELSTGSKRQHKYLIILFAYLICTFGCCSRHMGYISKETFKVSALVNHRKWRYSGNGEAYT